MEERLIFSNLINQTEFLRSLARVDIPSFNTRVLNTIELCEEINARNGIVVPSVLNNEEYIFKILNLVLSSPYKEKFKSYEDIRHLASTIQSVRLLVDQDNDFIHRPNSLLDNESIKILQYVISQLNPKDFDYVSYIRETIKNIDNLKLQVIYFKEENISYLEKQLLKKINAKEVSLLDYVKAKKITEPSINAYYGEENEIESVLTYIYQNKLSFDSCLIVLTNPSKYLDTLYRYNVERNIPITFASGVPIHLSNPYKICRLIYDLEHIHHFDVNGYRHLFNAESFILKDKNLPEILGRLKIDFNKDQNDKKLKAFLENKYCDFLLSDLFRIYNNKDNPTLVEDTKKDLIDFVNTMSLGKTEFIKKFTIIRNNEIDALSLDAIVKVINKSELINDSNLKVSYLDSIDNKKINASASKPGYLHIVNLNNASSFIRENVFILGLSATNFPGKRHEDYLINDNELLSISNDATTSRKKIEIKNELFNTLISYIGTNIHLSYSCFDINEVKDVNPSSVIFRIAFSKGDDYLKNLKQNAMFYSGELNKNRTLAKSYLSNQRIIIPEEKINLPVDSNSLVNFKYYSPSNIELFLNCPLKFYASVILGIEEVKDYDRYQVIEANHFGTLVHKMMENYALSDEEYKNKINDVFNAYLTLNVPLVSPKDDYQEFFNACNNGRNYLKSFNKIINFEKWVTGKYKDINLRGRYDCLAEKDGKLFLIDFKTDREINRDYNDTESIFQMLLYLYMLRQSKVDIARGQYFYLRHKRITTNVFYNDFKEKEIFGMLDFFKTSLDTRSFNKGEAANCTFCPISGVCPLKKKNG